MVGAPSSKGCGTCRRRKKGCDLQRPTCQRCRATGLYCEGYQANIRFVPHSTAQSQSATQSQASVRDRKAGSSKSTALEPSSDSSDQPLPSIINNLNKAPDAVILTSTRKRTWFPKAVTGCLTCKKRRVKCDETKPVCRRCTKSGIHCDGYNAPKATLFDHQASFEERRRMDFFFKRTVPSIETCNTADNVFWTELVLQAAHVGSPLRHALLSIQAFHESLIDHSNRVGHHQYAQMQYSQALRSLVGRPRNTSNADVSEILAVAVALRSVEVFRNNAGNAVVHLMASRSFVDATDRSWMRNSMIANILQPMIRRLEFASLPLNAIANGSIASDAGNIERARQEGHASLAWVCHALLHSDRNGIDFEEFWDWTFLPRLKRWYTEVEIAAQKLIEAGRSTRDADYCKIQFHLVSIAARLIPCEDEMIFDQMLDVFEILIALCVACTMPQTSDVHLSFGVELVATAFLVGSRCRDPVVRRKAVKLLQETHIREIRWCSFQAAAILLWQIDKEECGSSPTTASDIPKRSRLILHMIQYHHENQNGSVKTPDPAKSFETPPWIRISYSTATDFWNVQHQWLFVPGPGETTHTNYRDRFSIPPVEHLTLAYEVREPLMPSTAAMMLLAYRQATSRSSDASASQKGLFECDASHDGPCLLSLDPRLNPHDVSSSSTPSSLSSSSSSSPARLCSIRNLPPEKLPL